MYLKTEEVNLFYEVRGEGQPLLLIHGIVVDSRLFSASADILARHYQVITYDRRGSSRSVCGEEVSYDLDAQERDIVALLDALGIERIRICGVSAGAVIGQYFALHHPERIERIILYEPALLYILQDESINEWLAMVKDLIARGKLNRAAWEFVKSIGDLDGRAPKKPREVSVSEMQNMHHCLVDEFGVFMDYEPDIDQCRRMSDRIFVAVGEKTGDHPYPRASRLFAEQVGATLLHYPGCHNLPSDLPTDFAVCVMGTLLL